MRINPGGIDTVNVIFDALMPIMRIARGTESGSAPATAGCRAKARERIAVDEQCRPIRPGEPVEPDQGQCSQGRLVCKALAARSGRQLVFRRFTDGLSHHPRRSDHRAVGRNECPGRDKACRPIRCNMHRAARHAGARPSLIAPHCRAARGPRPRRGGVSALGGRRRPDDVDRSRGWPRATSRRGGSHCGSRSRCPTSGRRAVRSGLGRSTHHCLRRARADAATAGRDRARRDDPGRMERLARGHARRP